MNILNFKAADSLEQKILKSLEVTPKYIDTDEKYLHILISINIASSKGIFDDAINPGIMLFSLDTWEDANEGLGISKENMAAIRKLCEKHQKDILNSVFVRDNGGAYEVYTYENPAVNKLSKEIGVYLHKNVGGSFEFENYLDRTNKNKVQVLAEVFKD